MKPSFAPIGSLALLLLLGVLHSSFAAMPAELKLVEGSTTVLFPVRMQVEGVLDGDVDVLLDVDADGKVVDWIVLSASHEGFIPPAVQTLRRWRFEPLEEDGQAIRFIVPAVFQFDYGELAHTSFGPSVVFSFLNEIRPDSGRQVYVARMSELARLPQPLEVERPKLFSDLPLEEQKGRVVFTFYIDREGRVRIPVVTELEGNPLLAESAAQALLEWRFEPARVKNHPVIVRAQQEFVFTGE
ncbi:MAG: energy transducer TonB [Opitutales bacterium]